MKQKWTLFFFILALSTFLRFLWINEFPLGLHPEEALSGNLAREALATATIKLWYLELNAGGLFVALEAVSLWIFGNTSLVLRLVSATFGILTLFGLFLAVKEATAKIAKEAERSSLTPTTLSCFFLATAYWHVQYSRFAFPEILVPFYFLFGMYFFLKGLRRGTILDTVWAGIFIGLGYYTTPLFWTLSILYAVPAGMSIRRYKQGIKTFCAPCALALLVFTVFVITIPLDLHFFRNPQDFLPRVFFRNFFIALRALPQNMFTFSFVFNAGENALRNSAALIPLVAGALGMSASWILTNIIAWFEKQKGNFPRRARQIKRIQRNIVFLVCAALFLLPLKTYHVYFFRWAQHPSTYFSQTTDLVHLGEYLAELPEEQKKYVVTNASDPRAAHTVMFASQTARAEERKKENMEYVSPKDAQKIMPRRDSVITFLDGGDRISLEFFQKKFPELFAKAPGDFVILEKRKEK